MGTYYVFWGARRFWGLHLRILVLMDEKSRIMTGELDAFISIETSHRGHEAMVVSRYRNRQHWYLLTRA